MHDTLEHAHSVYIMPYHCYGEVWSYKHEQLAEVGQREKQERETERDIEQDTAREREGEKERQTKRARTKVKVVNTRREKKFTVKS